MDVKYWNFFWY